MTLTSYFNRLRDRLLSAIESVNVDEQFASAALLEKEEEIFHLSDSMKRYVQVRLRPKKEVEQKTHRLKTDKNYRKGEDSYPGHDSPIKAR